MARGKEALLAANRRCTAAHEVIDRLTTEVAEAKLRARLAEQRIQELEPRAARTDELEAQCRDDRLLADALNGLHDWRKIADQDWQRRKAAWSDLRQLQTDLSGLGPMGMRDAGDFIIERYPRLVNALSAGRTSYVRTREDTPTYRKLSTEDRKRLDRAFGNRAAPEWDPEADAANVLADLLDARQIGLSPNETRELLGLAAGAAAKA